MKVITFTLLLLMSFKISAHLVHRKNMEAPPESKRRHLNRLCFTQMQELGCGHPAEDQRFFKSCLSDNKDLLNDYCQEFFFRLYGDQRTHGTFIE